VNTFPLVAVPYGDMYKIQAIDFDMDDLNNHYESRSLKFDKKKYKNPHIHQYRVFNEFNRERTLFELNDKWQKNILLLGGFYKYITYKKFSNFTFAGTKSEIKSVDVRRKRELNYLVNTLNKHNIDYGLTEFHLALDIRVNDSVNFVNLLPVKLTKSVNISNPLKQKYETSFYVEDGKSYLYVRAPKQKIKSNTIRFEIKFKFDYETSRDPIKVIEKIETELKKYELYYIHNNKKRDEIKIEYSNRIKKEYTWNISPELHSKLNKFGDKIELKLSQELKDEIHNLLNFSNHQIVKRDTHQFQNMKITGILKLYSTPIGIIEVNPLILRVFLHLNKSPPTKILTHPPGSDLSLNHLLKAYGLFFLLVLVPLPP
jgi:hypothetical protein